MHMRATLFGAAALALITSTAQAQSAETVVATVGETEITLGEMIAIRAALPQQYSQFPPEVLWDGILEQLVQQQLLADTTRGDPLRVELALKNERRSLLAGEALNTFLQTAVTEEAIQDAYVARFEGLEMGQEFNASHLLVGSEEEALAALERINNGEEFADVARSVSTGPTGPNGGNLGWFGEGQMVPPFEEAVKALQIGGVSGPVQTQFGWHIVKLNEMRVSEQPPLEDLRAELTQEVQARLIDEYLDALMAETTVTLPDADAFDPALLMDMSLLEP